MHNTHSNNNERLQKSYLTVAQNASGRNLNVPIYTISDNKPGPTVYIQSSIHGAEVQGNVVIFHLLQALQNTSINGKIILVPNCNPVGTNIKAGEYTLGRFDPVNGTNWNRGYYYNKEQVLDFANGITAQMSQQQITTAFKAMCKQAIETKLAEPWGLGLAQQLNLHLQKMAVEADIVLDLHNGPVSTRHIYIPEYCQDAAKQFAIEHCIFIPNHFAGALDEAIFCPWWTLQDTLSDKFSASYNFGVQAFTLEMGSQEVINFGHGKQDSDSILGYLASQGVLSHAEFPIADISRTGVNLANYKTMYTDFGGMVDYCAAPGQHVKKGEVLAKVLNIDDLDNHHALHQVLAPCDLIPILHFPSASVLSGTQLYKCFTQYFKIS
ncbi:MAG: succinylglutamate desuccinylase/aspartoacylase family protein [Glaciecola sp.]